MAETETAQASKAGETPTVSRRGFLRRVGIIGTAVAVGGAVGGGLAWWQRGEYEDRQERRAETLPRYIELSWSERPDFTQGEAEVLHFAGDPKAEGKAPRERGQVALMGIPRASLERQVAERKLDIGVVYWSQNGNADVAHVARLGMIENMGVTQRPQNEAQPGGTQIDVLTVGMTVGENSLHASLVGIGADDRLVSLQDLERIGEEGLMDVSQVGANHPNVPVV